MTRAAFVLLLLFGCAAHTARQARREQLSCIDRSVAEMHAAMAVSDQLHAVRMAEIRCTTDCLTLKQRDLELSAQLEHDDRTADATKMQCQAYKTRADDAVAAAQNTGVSCTTNTVGGTTFTNCN